MVAHPLALLYRCVSKLEGEAATRQKAVFPDFAPRSGAGVGVRTLSPMARSDPDLNVALSLLDRLIDRDPRAKTDAAVSRAAQRRGY